MKNLIAEYNTLVNAGTVTDDAAQKAALPEFERIRAALAAPVKRGFFRKAPTPPKGLYLWGGVGRGKSMLMDFFVSHVTVPARRVHFHAFMQEIDPSVNLQAIVPLPMVVHVQKACFPESFVIPITAKGHMRA